MVEKSKIKIIRDENSDVYDHIAMITGKRCAPKPTYYRNNEAKENYYAICAALAFPFNRTPGFSVFLAALRDGDPNKPIFKVIDELEEPSMEILLQTCDQRRYRWGHPYHQQLNCFYGDPVRFASIVNDFNLRNESGLYIIHPADFETPNRSEIYMQRVLSFLKQIDGKSRLKWGNCERLRSHLQNLPQEVKSIEEYPAVAALGYAVHSLESMKPWMRSAARTERYVDFEDTDGTAKDDLFNTI